VSAYRPHVPKRQDAAMPGQGAGVTGRGAAVLP
jgi:hypothetical protein